VHKLDSKTIIYKKAVFGDVYDKEKNQHNALEDINTRLWGEGK
jgi:hypothetical protein